MKKAPEFIKRVADLMADGKWRSVRQVAKALKCSETGASARLRDLRKAPFRRTVERKRCRDGLNLYRVA